jgi:DNA replication protein DnaC
LNAESACSSSDLRASGSPTSLRPWATRRAAAASTWCSPNGGRADGTYERRLQTYIRPDLLILDDFGLKPLHPPAPEDLYEIINERYERGSLIVTSNRAFSEWPELFSNPLLASAALDRLAHGAHQIIITGESFRAKGRRRAGGGSKEE